MYATFSTALHSDLSGGVHWAERCSDIFHDIGFFPSKTEDDIWMRDWGDHYEYIARYIDDLATASKEPEKIILYLQDVQKLKLKGTGPISFHFGCDFYRDQHGTLCMSPKKYIEKMVFNFKKMFGDKPRPYTSPLEKGDHPQLDTTEELPMEDIKKFQFLIGSIQWAVSIGKLDVCTAVMTLSKFRACLQKRTLG